MEELEIPAFPAGIFGERPLGLPTTSVLMKLNVLLHYFLTREDFATLLHQDLPMK
jgi:hypothetical protein